MSNPSLDCTVCMLEGAVKTPSSFTPNLPEGSCSGIEEFGGGRGGGGGGWRRGYNNWRGGYYGHGYLPYWYGSHYYQPLYYDYPYESRQPVVTNVVKPGGISGNVAFMMALVALVFAIIAFRK
jgi:hypothetical protein